MRDILIALSLANLLFLRAWEKSNIGSFLDDFKPDKTSIAFCVLLTGALLWLSWRLARNYHRLSVAARIIFLFLLLIPLNALRLYYDQSFVPIYTDKYRWLALLLLAVLALPIIVAAFRRRLRLQFLTRYGIVLLLMLAPFMIFTLGGALLSSYRAVRQRAAQTKPAERPRVALKANASRVVWIIFDELDMRLAFKERPASVTLPEFDRFRAESFVASAAHPPGAQTGQSVPALLNGSMVPNETPHGETALAIWGDDPNQVVIWNRDMTIFSETSREGVSTGLAGVYFPYCAILGRSIDSCRDFRSYRTSESLPKSMSRSILLALDAIPFASRLWLGQWKLRNDLEEYEFAAREANALAADQNFDFVYIHLPIPHPPAIYDRRTAQLDVTTKHSYLDNVALADVCFGNLRRAMEQSGTWQKSTVIVTADHWWRTYFWRDGPYWGPEDSQTAGRRMPEDTVPLMIKLAGNQGPFIYSREFNTVITRKMIMQILKQGIPSNSELARWLDTNAIGPVKPIWHPPKTP